ncbi:MAG TPA: hypothetical protein VK436_13075 [Methanocella sp.]|nr:hypothetical protein [Methanocella sp.]
MIDYKHFIFIALLFLSVSLLIASSDYSSDVIALGSVGSPISGGDRNWGGGSPALIGAPDPQGKGYSDAKTAGAMNGINLSLQNNDRQEKSDLSPTQDTSKALTIILIAAILLAAIMAAAFIIIHKHRGKRMAGTAPSSETVIECTSSGAAGSNDRYAIRFPQILDPFPPTWGMGEPLEMSITSLDPGLITAIFSIDGTDTRAVRLENGTSTVTLSLSKGCHRISAGSPNDPQFLSGSWTEVRIVDYREEIVRLFNEMFQSFKSCMAGIRNEMTAGEIERSAGGQIPKAKQRLLSVAVEKFEVANYSLHDVGREEYESMYISRISVPRAGGERIDWRRL